MTLINVGAFATLPIWRFLLLAVWPPRGLR